LVFLFFSYEPLGLTLNKTGNVRRTETPSCDRCCSVKAVSITYSECAFVVLVNQHAKRMTLCCHLWPIFQSHERHDLRFKRKITENSCLDFLYNFWNNFHYNNNSARCSHKCTLVFMYSVRCSCQILMKLQLSKQIVQKYSKISNFMKIRPVAAALFHVVGRTDRHEEANCFVSQFCERD